MSKESFTFENENGKIAYLVGVVDSLSDEHLVKACPQYASAEVDLFEIDEDKNFNEAIAKRLKKYLPSIGGDADAIEKKIDNMNIAYEKENGFDSIQAPSFIMTMFERIPDYVHSKIGDDAFASFCRGTEYYLGKPIGYYRAIKGFNILSNFYTGMIFDVVFIEYEGYLLMISRGTSE